LLLDIVNSGFFHAFVSYWWRQRHALNARFTVYMPEVSLKLIDIKLMPNQIRCGKSVIDNALKKKCAHWKIMI